MVQSAPHWWTVPEGARVLHSDPVRHDAQLVKTRLSVEQDNVPVLQVALYDVAHLSAFNTVL